MRFGEAHWLWLLLVMPVLAAFLVWALRRRERDLSRWCGRGLWGRLIADRRPLVGWWRAGLLVVSVFFLVLTAARPQIGSRILEVKRTGVDVMIALDVSESMLAEDMTPNRITRARHEIHSLISRLRGDRVGLVAFAGEAFVQCPLTLDYAAARMFLRFMDTDLIPVPGTAISEAVRTATGAFDPKERKFKALVLITDGEDHQGNLAEAAREAREQGVRIFAVGIGTTQGEPIPLRDATGTVRDYKRDRNGNVVLSKLDPTALRRLCEDTGGRYFDGAAGGLALDRLHAEIAAMEQKEMQGGIMTQYEDRYGYFAGAALLLLALESMLGERRRARRRARDLANEGAVGTASDGAARKRAAALPLLFWATLALAGPALLGFSGRAEAADPGTRAYRKGDYQSARDAYERYNREHPGDPRGDYNLGTTLHQVGELTPAERALERALLSDDPGLRADAFHNLGNTRVRSGDYAGAVAAYEMALRTRPGDKETKHNLEIARTLLQSPPPDSTRQNQQNRDQQNQDQDQDQDQNQDPQNQDQNQDQQDEDQQEQNQQNQDQDQQSQDQDQDTDSDGRPEDQSDDERQQDQDEPDRSQDPNAGEDRRSGGSDDHASDEERQEGEMEMPPPRISPDEARQILDGLAQQEMLLQAERMKAKSRATRVEKDW